MATKRNGEKYLGHELHAPLSEDGQVTAYVWPVRALYVRGAWCGGPTIGDSGGQRGGHPGSTATTGRATGTGAGMTAPAPPGNSQRPFPDGVTAVADQLDWSLAQVRECAAELLAEGGTRRSGEIAGHRVGAIGGGRHPQSLGSAGRFAGLRR